MEWIKSAGHDYTELKQRVEDQIEQTKKCIKVSEKKIEKRKVKAMRQAGESFCNVLSDLLTIVNEHKWLTEKFGEGEYKDVLGLCKIATIEDIDGKNYTLTPGAYVGVAEAEDDGIDF